MKTRLTALALSLSVLTFGAGFAIGFAAPAIAQEKGFAVDFAYKHTELASDTGRAALLKRLESAVERQCVTSPGVSAKHRARPCIERTMTTVITRIGSKELAEAFHSRAAG